MEDILIVAVKFIPIILAITLHEAAHAYVAKMCGDYTAYGLGRVSLNPIVHIDPIGTILVPAFLYFASGGAFLFGWAKPVPINYSRLKNIKRDIMLVSGAGPASNLLMAIGWGIVASFFHHTNPNAIGESIAVSGMVINLVLMTLNLIPILPLDGGRIVNEMLPYKISKKFEQSEQYGMFILIGLMFLGVLSKVIMPVVGVGVAAISFITFLN